MKLLLMTGGIIHPYDRSTPVLKEFLTDAGHEVIVREDSDALSDGTLSNMDALVFNTTRVETHSLEDTHQNSMADFIYSGKGFVCLHMSSLILDSWQEYSNITGGGWNRGESYHPPFENFRVDALQKSARFSDERSSLQISYFGTIYVAGAISHTEHPSNRLQSNLGFS